jgi:hypothetical protein
VVSTRFSALASPYACHSSPIGAIRVGLAALVRNLASNQGPAWALQLLALCPPFCSRSKQARGTPPSHPDSAFPAVHLRHLLIILTSPNYSPNARSLTLSPPQAYTFRCEPEPEQLPRPFTTVPLPPPFLPLPPPSTLFPAFHAAGVTNSAAPRQPLRPQSRPPLPNSTILHWPVCICSSLLESSRSIVNIQRIYRLMCFGTGSTAKRR